MRPRSTGGLTLLTMRFQRVWYKGLITGKKRERHLTTLRPRSTPPAEVRDTVSLSLFSSHGGGGTSTAWSPLLFLVHSQLGEEGKMFYLLSSSL